MIRIQGENYRTGVVSLQRSERGLMLGEWNYLFTYFVGSFGIQLLLLGLFVSISMSLLPGVRVDRNRMQVSFKREGKKVELSGKKKVSALFEARVVKESEWKSVDSELHSVVTAGDKGVQA